MEGMGTPGAEPTAPGELDSPAPGDAASGSLPGAVSKSLPFDPEDFFAGIVAEVLA